MDSFAGVQWGDYQTYLAKTITAVHTIYAHICNPLKGKQKFLFEKCFSTKSESKNLSYRRVKSSKQESVQLRKYELSSSLKNLKKEQLSSILIKNCEL